MQRSHISSKWDSPPGSPSGQIPGDGGTSITAAPLTNMERLLAAASASLSSSSHRHSDSDTSSKQSRIAGINALTSVQMQTKKLVPDGLSFVIYRAPDIDSFVFDHSTGYRFDPTTGLHYDANSGFFINLDLKKLLRWDPLFCTYQRVGDLVSLGNPMDSLGASPTIDHLKTSVQASNTRKRSFENVKDTHEKTLVPYEGSPETKRSRQRYKKTSGSASRITYNSPARQRKDSGSEHESRSRCISPRSSEQSEGRLAVRSVSRERNQSRANIRRARRSSSRGSHSRSRESRRRSITESRRSYNKGARSHSSEPTRHCSRESRRNLSRGARSRSRGNSRYRVRESRRSHSRESSSSSSRAGSSGISGRSGDRKHGSSVSCSPERVSSECRSKTGSIHQRSNSSGPKVHDESLSRITERKRDVQSQPDSPPKRGNLSSRDDPPSNLKLASEPTVIQDLSSTRNPDKEPVPKTHASDPRDPVPEEIPGVDVIDTGDLLGHLFTKVGKTLTNIILVAPVPLQNRSKNASDALKNQIGNPPDILKVYVNHESTSGSPCSFIVVPFKSANAAKQWYDSLNGSIILNGADGSRLKAYLHFLKKGNWNCEHCKSFNFFMQSICPKCFRGKDSVFSPVSISEEPTNLVGIAKLKGSCSTVERVTDSLPALNDFGILRTEVMSEPGGLSLGLCAFEVGNAEEGLKLREFFLHQGRIAVYLVMNEKPKTPEEVYLGLLFDSASATNTILVALVPLSYIADMNLELSLMEMYLIMLLKEDDVKYELTLHVDKIVGAPCSYALITFADAETAAQWLKSRRGTFNNFSASNQRSTISLHFAEDNWKCQSCNTLNFPLRSLCHHCFKHKVQNRLGPISQASTTTRWVAVPILSNWSKEDDYIIAHFRKFLKEFVFQGVEVIRDSKCASFPLACVFEMHNKVESLRLKEFLTKQGRFSMFVVMHKELNDHTTDDPTGAPDVVIVDEPPQECIDLTADDNPTECADYARTTVVTHVKTPLAQQPLTSSSCHQRQPRPLGGRFGAQPVSAIEPVGSQSIVSLLSLPPVVITAASRGQLGPQHPFAPQPPTLMDVCRPPIDEQPLPMRMSCTVPFKHPGNIIYVGPVPSLPEPYLGQNVETSYTKLFLKNGAQCKSVEFCPENCFGVSYNYCLVHFASPRSAKQWFDKRRGCLTIKVEHFKPIDAYLRFLGGNWLCHCNTMNSPTRSLCFRCYTQRGVHAAPLDRTSTPTKYISIKLFSWYSGNELAQIFPAPICRSFEVEKIRYFSDPLLDRDPFGIYVLETRSVNKAIMLRRSCRDYSALKSTEFVVLKDPDAGGIIELDFTFTPLVALRIVNNDFDFDLISGNMMEKPFIMGETRKMVCPDYETFLWTSVYEYRLNNPPTNIVMMSLCPGDQELPDEARAQILRSLEKAKVACKNILYCFKGDVGTPFSYCLVIFDSQDSARSWFDHCNGTFQFYIPHPSSTNVTLNFQNCFSLESTSESKKSYFIKSKLHYSLPNWICHCGAINFPLRSICHYCFRRRPGKHLTVNSYEYICSPSPSNFVGIRLAKYFTNLDPSHLVGARKLGYKISNAKICLDRSVPRDPCGVIIFTLCSPPEAMRFHRFLCDLVQNQSRDARLVQLMAILNASSGITFLWCGPSLESNWFSYQSENWDSYFNNEIATNIIAIYHLFLCQTIPKFNIPIERYGGEIKKFKRGGGFTPTFWLIMFPTPDHAKRWYDASHGVLRNQKKVINLYFTQGVWTCPQCQSQNFPARLLCFKCYTHKMNGVSPFWSSASPTRWVGVHNQSDHSLVFEYLENMDFKFRSIRIITDPVVRLDGPSILVFEVSTPGVGLLLWNFFTAKKLEVAFFLVRESPALSIAIESDSSEVSDSETSEGAKTPVPGGSSGEPISDSDLEIVDDTLGSNDTTNKGGRQQSANHSVASTSGSKHTEDLSEVSSVSCVDVSSTSEESIFIMSGDETEDETTTLETSSQSSTVVSHPSAAIIDTFCFSTFQTFSFASVFQKSDVASSPTKSPSLRFAALFGLETSKQRSQMDPKDALSGTTSDVNNIEVAPSHPTNSDSSHIISVCPVPWPGINAQHFYSQLFSNDAAECEYVKYCQGDSFGVSYNYCILHFGSPKSAKKFHSEHQGRIKIMNHPFPNIEIQLFKPSNAFLRFSEDNWCCECGKENCATRSICFRCYKPKDGDASPFEISFVPTRWLGVRLDKWYAVTDLATIFPKSVRSRFAVVSFRLISDPRILKDQFGIYIFETVCPEEAVDLRDFCKGSAVVKSTSFVLLKYEAAGKMIDLDVNPAAFSASTSIPNSENCLNVLPDVSNPSKAVIYPEYETIVWTSLYEYCLNNLPTDAVMISSCPGDGELPVEARAQIQASLEKTSANHEILYSLKGNVGSPFSYCLVYFDSVDSAKAWMDKCGGTLEFDVFWPEDDKTPPNLQNCYSPKSASKSGSSYVIKSTLYYTSRNWLCSCGSSNFPLRSLCHNCFKKKTGESEYEYISKPAENTSDGVVWWCSTKFVGIRLNEYFEYLDASTFYSVQKLGDKVSTVNIRFDPALPRDPRGVVIFEMVTLEDAMKFHQYLTYLKDPGHANPNKSQPSGKLMKILDSSSGIIFLKCPKALSPHPPERWGSLFKNETPTNIIIFHHESSTYPKCDIPFEPLGGKITECKEFTGFFAAFWMIRFPNKEAAKKWFDDNDGKLKNNNYQSALYFSKDFWTCRNCETKNFPGRVLCFVCFEHDLNRSLSPVRRSSSPTRWIGVTSTREQKQAVKFLANTKFLLRSIQIFADPNIRHNGTYVLVFEVASTKVGEELRRFFSGKKIVTVDFFTVYACPEVRTNTGVDLQPLMPSGSSQTVAGVRDSQKHTSKIPEVRDSQREDFKETLEDDNFRGDSTADMLLENVSFSNSSIVSVYEAMEVTEEQNLSHGSPQSPCESEGAYETVDEYTEETTQGSYKSAIGRQGSVVSEQTELSNPDVQDQRAPGMFVCRNFAESVTDTMTQVSVFINHLETVPAESFSAAFIALFGDVEPKVPILTDRSIHDPTHSVILVCPVPWPGANVQQFYAELFSSDGAEYESVEYFQGKTFGVPYDYCLVCFKSLESSSSWHSKCQGRMKIVHHDFPNVKVERFKPTNAFLRFAGENWRCRCGRENCSTRSVCFECYKHLSKDVAPFEPSFVPTNWVGVKLNKWLALSDVVSVFPDFSCMETVRFIRDPRMPRDNFGIYIFEMSSVEASIDFREYYKDSPVVQSTKYITLKDPEVGSLLELKLQANLKRPNERDAASPKKDTESGSPLDADNCPGKGIQFNLDDFIVIDDDDDECVILEEGEKVIVPQTQLTGPLGSEEDREDELLSGLLNAIAEPRPELAVPTPHPVEKCPTTDETLRSSPRYPNGKEEEDPTDQSKTQGLTEGVTDGPVAKNPPTEPTVIEPPLLAHQSAAAQQMSLPLGPVATASDAGENPPPGASCPELGGGIHHPHP